MKMRCEPACLLSEVDANEVEEESGRVDTLSREGAWALAKRLQAYWHARGYLAVCFWPEPLPERFAKVGTYEIYRVACNLVNGLPPPHRRPT